MLSIIFFILKLIGIILAFIVLLIILVLFVPIRYNIYANYKEDICGEFKVHWLLHLLHFKGVYVDENLRMKLRLLGLVVYDSDKVIKNPDKDDAKIDKKLKDNKLKDNKLKDNKLKDNKKLNERHKTEKIDLTSNEDIDKNPTENINPALDNIKQNNKHNEVEYKDMNNDSKKHEYLAYNNTNNINSIRDTFDENANNKENKYLKKVKFILSKFKSAIGEIYNIPKKVIVAFHKICQKFSQIKNKLLNGKKVVDRIKNSIEKIKLFLQDEINKDGMKHIFNGFKRILRHIKPKKVTGEIEFGAKAPYETGQILAIISMGYGLYGKNFSIYPNFNEEILVGNVKVAGRIRLITLLIIGVKLILYKNNRQLVKNIMVLKEEL